jgi:hypothetical protein
LLINSQRFYESTRSIGIFCSISWRITNQEKGKLENRGLSCQSFYESLRRSDTKRINTSIGCLKSKDPLKNCKTRSSSHSGLDKSSQKITAKISYNSSFKGTVRQILRWVMCGINCQLFLYCLLAYTFLISRDTIL